jgi:DNA-binding response OmpR family regulator
VPHVVIIDGSSVYAELYSGHLAFEGYRITKLPDFDVSPADVLRRAPDLIVLDLFSGNGQLGLDFLHRLRREPAGRTVPVLVSTPGALIDTMRYGAELAALGATVIGGFTVCDKLPDAAREALAAAPGARRRSDAA